MSELFLDFETASLLDLREVGSYNYCQHQSTRVLMLAFAFDDEEPELWLPNKGPLPERVRVALLDPTVIKKSWHVGFERNVLKYVMGIDAPWEQWVDIMIQARYLSLPGSLEDVCDILGLSEDEAKIKKGKELIKLFCEPFRLGGEETLFGIAPPEFHDWDDRPEDWKLFEEYCKRDVLSERILSRKMFQIPESEQRAWVLDQKINERGIPTSKQMRENSLALAQRSKNDLLAEIGQLTGVENSNSNPQILEWAKQHTYPFGSIEKSFVKLALNNPKVSEECKKVLNLRQESSKTSFKKLETLATVVSSDGCLRDTFSFMGAARTGRWSSHGFQSQNMSRPIKEVEKDYDGTVQLILNNDYEGLKKYPSVIGAITSCLRSVFWADDADEFIVCDLASIEPRVLGWVSGCTAINEVFAKGQDLYISFAAQMYHEEYEALKEACERNDVAAKGKRQVAKPAVLGAGYGLGGGEEKKNDYGDVVKTGLWGYGEKMGVVLTREESHTAVKVFRSIYGEVKELWKNLETAAVEVICIGGSKTVGVVTFDRKKRVNGQYILRIHLPSGRCLHYMNVRIEEEKYTDNRGDERVRNQIIYDGIGHGVGAIGKGWGPAKTYGGKLTENIVQAIARDVLVNCMFLAEEKGADIRGTFHDEILCLRSKGDEFAFDLPDLKECMSQTPEWARCDTSRNSLLLGAEGWKGSYYQKK